MYTLLRLIALLLGTTLILAPALLALQFAHGANEGRMFDFIGPLLVLGLPLGLGPLLAAFPKALSGRRTPVMRVVTGLLLVMSTGMLLIVGFGGSLMQWISPVVCLVEILIFAAFVWPARAFNQNND